MLSTYWNPPKGKNPLDLQNQSIFFFNNTLEYRKVLMAFCHMDGETFVWYQDAKKKKKKKNQVNSMSWEVFISTL